MSFYAQVLPESQRRAVESLEGLLFQNVPKPARAGHVQRILLLKAEELWRALGDDFRTLPARELLGVFAQIDQMQLSI